MPNMPGDFSSPLMLRLLTALLLTAACAQTSAQTRAFQMALYAETDLQPGPDTDIPMFLAGQKQPAGRSILIRNAWDNVISADEYYWPRIVAVLIDEPYHDFDNLPTSCWTTDNVRDVNHVAETLATRAAELKAISPRTRFWVNLARPQLDWAKSGQCPSDAALAPVNVNEPYIDVISVDIYDRPFGTSVRPYYDWLKTHRAKPEQQMALAPATHHHPNDSRATRDSIASDLDGYFNYANDANQSCDLPLGSVWRTGIFDGCRVWMVMGWLAGDHVSTDGTFIGLRNPASEVIAEAWKAELAKPLRPDLARELAPKQLLPALSPLLRE